MARSLTLYSADFTAAPYVAGSLLNQQQWIAQVGVTNYLLVDAQGVTYTTTGAPAAQNRMMISGMSPSLPYDLIGVVKIAVVPTAYNTFSLNVTEVPTNVSVEFGMTSDPNGDPDNTYYDIHGQLGSTTGSLGRLITNETVTMKASGDGNGTASLYLNDVLLGTCSYKLGVTALFSKLLVRADDSGDVIHIQSATLTVYNTTKVLGTTPTTGVYRSTMINPERNRCLV